ncbi:hypothetical protein [Streptomyces scabiei]|uniref:hypothetical protein n=1 Tax=Streptomyces scabiei TaxID=1930 RepID=UPI0029BF12BB|nr:hypothetical protein [Streptomyces scabiei]MDX2802320.1 hypothetical protein [Streptomyces scabiei]MDX3277243.1 hypothetical protein [Streptomyces scabiei]
MAKIGRNADRREVRLDDAGERRHEVRSVAYAVASTARRLAAELDAEAERPDYRQPAGWHGSRLAVSASWYLAGRYTAAALDVLDEAQRLVAVAVAADRAAGADWSAIGDALGVSADTASRRHRGLPTDSGQQGID